MSSTTSEEVKLPKLDVSGKEWTTWKVRLQLATSSQGLVGYLDSSKKKPTDPATGQPAGWTASTPDEIKLVAEYEKDLATWTEKDMKMQHMIANTLPNFLFVCLVNKDSAHECYTTLCNLFEKCSLVVGAELRHQLGELKLKEGGDAHAHIEKIIALCEDLASIGHPVTDEDLFNIVYVSLPRLYNPGLAALSSTMCLQGSTITSDDLMDIMLEEYDRLTLQNGGKGKSLSSENAAFGADTSSKKGKGKGKKFGGNCWNCGWSGHKHSDCWEEGGGKAGQAPKGWKPKAKVNHQFPQMQPPATRIPLSLTAPGLPCLNQSYSSQIKPTSS